MFVNQSIFFGFLKKYKTLHIHGVFAALWCLLSVDRKGSVDRWTTSHFRKFSIFQPFRNCWTLHIKNFVPTTKFNACRPFHPALSPSPPPPTRIEVCGEFCRSKFISISWVTALLISISYGSLFYWQPTPLLLVRYIDDVMLTFRFGPYFVEPIIAGLDPKTNEPFIASTDLIGCITEPEDFVVSGTCADQLYGMSSYKL